MKFIQMLAAIASMLYSSGMSMALAAFVYVAFIEGPYLSYPDTPFPVVGTTFHAGEIVPLRVTRCNSDNRQHSYYLAHAVMNVKTKATYVMPEEYVQVPMGCTFGISFTHRLPVVLPPGQYIIFGGAQIRGTIRYFDVEWQSEPFVVVK
jgi:hypothetical protein